MTRTSPRLDRFAWLSIAAAIVTIGPKGTAYSLTGSVGLLSDALESVVNLAAAVLTLSMLTIAARPPDDDHAYGHSKAEYFASGVEGALILLAAAGIGWAAIGRLRAPQPIAQPGLGLAISTGASLVNFVVARVLLKAGHRHRSIALEADAHHLLTDVWTSAGVFLGVGAVAITGWQRLDPIVALLVAANIVWCGVQLMRRSALGLLDTALTPPERQVLGEVLERYAKPSLQFHAVRTRQAGTRRFVSMPVLVPGDWTVSRGHRLLEEIEHDICAALPSTTVLTHLEALEDPAAWQDDGLDRAASSASAAWPPGREGGP